MKQGLKLTLVLAVVSAWSPLVSAADLSDRVLQRGVIEQPVDPDPDCIRRGTCRPDASRPALIKPEPRPVEGDPWCILKGTCFLNRLFRPQREADPGPGTDCLNDPRCPGTLRKRAPKVEK
ncbi:hypothetical protein [Undibacter mobilis]|uniref:hypothetical protein n=1 Tax=Undibacter mobilis TaxID=2292256 RepID=UPI00143DD8CA|nr:hypothetical protein [Undibacter mobilis]